MYLTIDGGEFFQVKGLNITNTVYQRFYKLLICRRHTNRIALK